MVEVVDQFWLDQEITVSSWTRERAGLSFPFDAFQRGRPDGSAHRAADVPVAGDERTRFVEAVISPYTRGDGDHACHMTWRWQVPMTQSAPRPRQFDPFGLVCRYPTIGTPVLVASAFLMALALLTWQIPIVGAWLAGPAIAVLALFRFLDSQPFVLGELGGTILQCGESTWYVMDRPSAR